MYPDDVFRNELAAVTQNLTRWAEPLKDAANIEIRDASGYWRISARPKTPGACPMTLVLRNDQKFDLSLSTERFEDRAIDDFALFGAIAQAVAAGHVELVRSSCALTGGLKSIETRVTFSDGVVWSHVRKTGPLARAKTGSPDVQDAEDFLPYLR